MDSKNEEALRGLIGKKVRLTPFDSVEGMKNGLFYNSDMSRCINDLDPYVVVIGLYSKMNSSGRYFELTCKFANGSTWYVMPERIEASEMFCLFI